MIERTKCFLLSFVSAFFLLSLIVMAAVLWVKPVSRPQSAPSPSVPPYLPQAEDSFTILLSERSSDDTPLFFLLIGFQPHRGQIPFAVFPPELSLSVENSQPLREQYKSGGICAVRDALSEQLSAPIDHWAEISEADFSELIDLFSPVSLNLPQSFQYKQGDLSVTLQPGLQSIDGAKALHLLSAPWGSSQAQQRFLEELVEKWLYQYLRIVQTNQSQDYFQKIVNKMETDLSILDYSSYHPMLLFLSRLSRQPLSCYRLSTPMPAKGSLLLSEKEAHLLSKVFSS